MSTRSNIARYDEKTDTLHRIYCHSDGYPSYNGSILLEHYQDEDKVKALIKLGDLSSLGPEIGEKWDFDEWPPLPEHKNWTRSYGRDRREKNVGAQKFKVGEKPLENFCEQEYLYVWKDGKWWFTDGYLEITPLTPKMCVEE
jgi:hypothetical protein